MLILLTFQHFYMTKSEAFASDFVDSLSGRHDAGRFRVDRVSGAHLLNMVDIIERFQGFDDLAVGLVFLQHLIAD